MHFFWLAFSLVLLTVSADFLVRGAISLANRFGLPPLFIGLSVVGFGTSLPELLVSVQAGLDRVPAIAVGNVVGSNIANILLILGLAATISPIAARSANLKRDLLMMIFAALVMAGLGYRGVVEFWPGLCMVVFLIAYIGWVASTDRVKDMNNEAELKTRLNMLKELSFLAGGFAGLFLGADLLVGAATTLAREFGIPEAVIGLTIVAVGTSLPELVTSIVAALRGQADVALGNIVGSNIFNILAILGLTGMIIPVPVEADISHFDIPVMILVSMALFALIIATGRIGRLAGVTMLAAYIGYVTWLF